MAISRAVRTPAEIESQGPFRLPLGPPVPGPGGGLYLPEGVSGHPAAEILWAYELGYRARIGSWASVDLATFYNKYTGLIGFGDVATFVPGVPFGIAEIPWTNAGAAESRGGEALLTFAPLDSWRLTAGYTYLSIRTRGEALATFDPEHQASLRSSSDFGEKTSLDVELRYAAGIEVPALGSVAGGSVPSYVTANVRLGYRPVKALELSLTGQNLLDRQHPESVDPFGAPAVEVPRGVYGRVVWHF